ncbi:hypothetical protein Pmar_PMAR008194, partial [Perkinsus marinus ATCC 50983]
AEEARGRIRDLLGRLQVDQPSEDVKHGAAERELIILRKHVEGDNDIMAELKSQ